MISDVEPTFAAAPADAGISARKNRKANKAKATKSKAAAPHVADDAASPKEAPPTLTPEVLGAGTGHGLSANDGEFLAGQEAIIESGSKGFLQVGRALARIRDYRDGVLWKDRYGTFQNYCRVRWGFEPQQGYRLMDAAEVAGQLDSSPIGDESPGPSCEGQLRPLAKLRREKDRVEAWRRAAEMAAGGPVTARHVEGVVLAMLKEGAEPRSERAQKSKKVRGPAKAPRPGGAIASDAPHAHARGEGDVSAEPAEVGGDAPQECGPVTEALFLRQLDAIEPMMVALRDPDIVLSATAIKRSKEFHRSLGRFVDAAEIGRASCRERG